MAPPSCSPLLGWILVFFFFWTFSVLIEGSNIGVEAERRNYYNPDIQEVTSIASRKYRTAYHFQPPKNWINDPNGPMYYNGVYHLFYQYNPYSALWGNITWGHSVSTDLINWTPLSLALEPTHPFDINGCWSGSATILPGNKPVIIYTGIDSTPREVQNIAFPKNLSDPFLREWIKPDYNPIMEPVGGLKLRSFRDPTTAWLGQDGLWRLAVGAEINQKGMVLLYRSKDFVNWVRAEDPLHSTNGSGMFECPDFYRVWGKQQTICSLDVDGKHVMKMSLYDTLIDRYMLGRYDEEKDVFVPDNAEDHRMWLRYDYGNFYASKTFFDPQKNRRILWGWSNESDSKSDDVAKGWSGIQTFPRAVWLAENGRQLVQWPIEELESLRSKEVHLYDIELKTGGLFEIKGVEPSEADIELEFELPYLERAEPFDSNWVVDPQRLCNEKGPSIQGGVGPFGLLVLSARDLEEHTAIFFRVFKADVNNYVTLMCSDQRRSSLRAELYKPAYGGFVDIDIKKDGKISLRTLIDHSVIESFGGGGRACITSRVYPELLVTGDTRLYAFNNGSETVKISEIRAWTIKEPQINQQ